jgi:hypothetical protein
MESLHWCSNSRKPDCGLPETLHEADFEIEERHDSRDSTALDCGLHSGRRFRPPSTARQPGA